MTYGGSGHDRFRGGGGGDGPIGPDGGDRLGNGSGYGNRHHPRGYNRPTANTDDYDNGRADVIVTHHHHDARLIGGGGLPVPTPTGGTTPSVLPRSFDTNLGRPAPMRTLTVNGSLSTIPVVYGTQRVGASVAFVQTAGVYLYVVFVLCEGPIQSVDKIWIDNKRVDFAAGNVGLGLVLNTDYFVYTGTAAQTVNAMIAGVNANWVSGMPGTAYVVIRFPAPTETTGSYDPLRFIAEIKGKKVVDPRTDLTTYAYSDNPALHLFDLLSNPTYGAGFPTDFMDSGTTGTWASAATDCDASLSRPTAPGTAPTKNSDTGGSGVIDGGNYAYTLTFFDASGVESIESAHSGTINSPTGQAMIMNIITGPAGTTARGLYRTKSGDYAAGDRFLVKKIANNSATTVTDDVPDASLGIRAPQFTKRYTMGLMLRDAAPIQQWVETIRGHFLGYLAYDGQYRCYVDKAKSATALAYTEDSIIGIPTIRSKGAAEVPTKVVVAFTDAQNGYVDATAEKELDTVATRVDERRELRLSLPGILSFDQAARIALQHLNTSTLRDKEVEWYVTAEGVEPLPGDRVTVTHSAVGLSGADVLLLDCEPTNDGMRWRLKGEFYDAAVYSDSVQTNPTPISPFLADTAFNPSVTTVNSAAGAITLAAGTNITITPAGSTFTIASTAGGSGTAVQKETPTGTINGINRVFTLAHTPSGSIYLRRNRAPMIEGTDYTRSTLTITYATDNIPAGSDVHEVDYSY